MNWQTIGNEPAWSPARWIGEILCVLVVLVCSYVGILAAGVFVEPDERPTFEVPASVMVRP